jgi:predicted amidophosphoribosyltransferase
MESQGDFDQIEFECPQCGRSLDQYEPQCPHCGSALEDEYCATYRLPATPLVKAIALIVLIGGIVTLVAVLVGLWIA